ncbi:MAG: DMT family transporter [Actinomycetota bacterium]
MFFAVVLALVGTVLVNYSMYMQKRELNDLPRLELKGALKTLRAFVSNVSWLEAQGLMFLGTFIHSIALIFGPLSVIAPIHTSGVVLLAILAIFKLGERAELMDWIGIGATFLGLVFLGISLAGTSGAESAHNTFFTTFFIVLLYLTAGACFINAFLKKGARESVLIAIGTGVLLGLNDILEKLFWPDAGNRLWNEGFWHVFLSPYLWMIVAIAVVTLFMNQVALQRGKAIVVIPVVNSLSNLIPILVGLMAFGEPFPSSFGMIFLRLLSIVLIVGGAVVLSIKKEGDSPEAASHGDA